MQLALLGNRVGHSLSPAMHNAALLAHEIPGRYVARDVDESGMRQAVHEIRDGLLHGANVTMPHKQIAATLSDRAAPEVERAGAANTLVRLQGEVVAHNTDIAGIVDAWRWNSLASEGAVLILGAGGAAAAALLALERRELYVSARRRQAAVALIARLGVTAEVIEWGEGVAGATLVNATALGMSGEPLPDPVLETCSGFFEMPYAAGETRAERVVRSRGMPVSTGTDMLLAQAAHSFRLWTGRPAPTDVMRRALNAAMAAG